MESSDTLLVFTDIELEFPPSTLSTLGQPIDQVATFLPSPSATIPSIPASPGGQSDVVYNT